MKTDLANISGTSQSLSYSKAMNKMKRQQAALQIFSEKENQKKRDSVSFSGTVKIFSRDGVSALIYSNVEMSDSNLSYYFDHYDDPQAILDAINFGDNVGRLYNGPHLVNDSDNIKYGLMHFDYNGIRQFIPNYAVPKIKTDLLSSMRAVDNSLVLDNKSYYAWTASSGDRYAWSVHNGYIRWAASESLLSEPVPNQAPGTSYRWEMTKASHILTSLAKGEGDNLFMTDSKEVLSVCEKVGLTPGFISIDAGAGTWHYILQESGRMININREIARLNSTNWIEIGYKAGDKFSVYGNEYTIDSSGHIHASTDGPFTSTRVIYPQRSAG